MKFKTLTIYYPHNRLLICDWKFYIQNETTIIDWADECTPGWNRQGMVLDFICQGDVSTFMLRWN